MLNGFCLPPPLRTRSRATGALFSSERRRVYPRLPHIAFEGRPANWIELLKTRGVTSPSPWARKIGAARAGTIMKHSRRAIHQTWLHQFRCRWPELHKQRKRMFHLRRSKSKLLNYGSGSLRPWKILKITTRIPTRSNVHIQPSQRPQTLCICSQMHITSRITTRSNPKLTTGITTGGDPTQTWISHVCFCFAVMFVLRSDPRLT